MCNRNRLISEGCAAWIWMAVVATIANVFPTVDGACTPPYPDGVIPDRGLCVEIFQGELVVDESRFRGLTIHNGEVFAIERAGAFNEWENLIGYVVVYDPESENSDTATGGRPVNTTSTVLASGTGLTHGIAVSDTHVYATSADTVFRWSYSKGRRVPLGDPERIIESIPSSSNQSLHTRSLLLTESLLYVSIGSESNVDPDLGRAGIRTFPLASSFPMNWTEGTVVATGLRNAVGIALDENGNLWAVDSSADDNMRADLGDISDDNPADELNLIDPVGRTYGFPFCWTEYRLPPTVANGPGSQWAWHDSTIFPEPKEDAWCRDIENNVPPVNVFPAHSAPLGLTFYQHREAWPEDCPSGIAFPDQWDGHAFVAYHGNYFRDEPVSGQVVRIPISSEGNVIGGVTAVPGYVLRDAGPLSGIRPVDLGFDRCGRLLLTSDGRPGSKQGRMILRMQRDPSFAPGGTSSNGFSTPVTVGLIVIVGMIVIAIGVGFIALGKQNRNTVRTIFPNTSARGVADYPEVELN